MKIPVSPPTFYALMQSEIAAGGPQVWLKIAAARTGALVRGKYQHWDILRHLEPPSGLTVEQWWLGLKMARTAMYQTIPLQDKGGMPFQYALPDIAQRLLHEIDRDASGTIQISEQVTNPQTRDTYLYSSLIEEAITSSQLEGAATTREVAKNMIKRGREPQDRSERMIYNNYRALLFIRDVIDQPLTPKILFEIHRTLVDGTLDDPDAAGRTRNADEHICVSDEIGTMLHDPPPANELAWRIEQMCAFANQQSADPFVHPVIRAVLLHFWLAYDHPFVDGNGRTARALFYWSMVRQGYWLAEFLSISRIIKKARGAYGRSFLYTETDDNDATYFILGQLRIVTQAIQELHLYLAKKAVDLKKTAGLLQQSDAIKNQLNYRQLALMNHALKRPHAEYTFESHRRSHNVSYATARADLLDLADQHLLITSKVGRTFNFTVPRNLYERLSNVADARQAAGQTSPQRLLP